MPKSKNRKEHKKKVAARNIKIKHDKDKYQNIQKELLMKLIEDEKKRGLYENLSQVGDNNLPIEGPSI